MLPLICCLAAGVGIGSVILSARASSKDESAKSSHHATHVASTEEVIGRIDECFEAGEFRTASRLCNKLIDSGNEQFTDQIRYRLALACEGLGDFDEAINIFGELSESDRVASRASAAKFGLARCMVLAGRWEEAEALLTRLDQTRTDPTWNGLPIAAEIACWRAALRIVMLESGRRAVVFVPSAVMSLEIRSPVGRYLTWAQGEAGALTASTGAPAVDKDLIECQRGDEHISESERGRRVIADLRAATNVEIEHPFREAAALELANLAAYSGRLAEATREYEKVIASFPIGEAVRLAEYNLGLIRLRACDPEAARHMLLSAIDRAPKDALAGRAWWFIARSHLDFGEWEQALHPLKMAAANSSADTRAAATLGQSMARMYARADADAHAALGHGPRATIRKEPFQNDAAFLDAYSRFRLARQAHPQPMVETEDLLAALSDPPSRSILGPVGALLRGQAFHDLGMDERMAEFFETTLPTLKGPLVSRMAAILAEHYLRIGKVADAGRALLAFGHPAAPDPQTQLLFAEVALRQSHPDECLCICRGNLSDPAADRPANLRLMAKAFESLGDSRRAAECYAGRIPQE